MNAKLGSLIVAGALLAAAPALATGQTLYNACATAVGQFFNSYSCEVQITNLVSEIASAAHPDICLPPRFKPETAQPVVRAYMARHPEGAIRSENNIVYNALLEAYPCASPPLGR
ncbi:MAG: Rap1a/Tai family immunity protein [Rhizomicrobium sp.]